MLMSRLKSKILISHLVVRIKFTTEELKGYLTFVEGLIDKHLWDAGDKNIGR